MNFDVKLHTIKNISFFALFYFFGISTLKFASMGCSKNQETNVSEFIDNYKQCEHSAMINCLTFVFSTYFVATLFVCSLKNNNEEDNLMPPHYSPQSTGLAHNEHDPLLPARSARGVFVRVNVAGDALGSQPPPYSVNNT